jgi:hypothetical protein
VLWKIDENGPLSSMIYWLVVLTILKNISQWEGLSHILWKITNVPNQQPDKHPIFGRCLPPDLWQC